MATKIIKITRGDSFEFVIDAVELQLNRLNPETDIVYFAIMEPNRPFEEALIVKGFTNQDQNNETGEILIKITPNDTRCLSSGVYYYTVKLQRGGTVDIIDDLDEPLEVRTLIDRTKFIVFD